MREVIPLISKLGRALFNSMSVGRDHFLASPTAPERKLLFLLVPLTFLYAMLLCLMCMSFCRRLSAVLFSSCILEHLVFSVFSGSSYCHFGLVHKSNRLADTNHIILSAVQSQNICIQVCVQKKSTKIQHGLEKYKREQNEGNGRSASRGIMKTWGENEQKPYCTTMARKSESLA